MKTRDLRVLVVDDIQLVRNALLRMLHSLGIDDVLAAGNGKQALELLGRETGRGVDIVLCDLDMPEMDGMEFIRRLGDRFPDLSVVIMSGLDDALIASVQEMTRAYSIRLLGALVKPLSSHRLEQLIELHPARGATAAPARTATPRMTLAEVLKGVTDKQFEPFFQPKVDFKTGRITGAEALARWNHPVQGVLAPAAFIPVLEQGGKMDELTILILEKAADASRRMQEQGLGIVVSVNLSLVSLSDTRLADRITQLVRSAGGDPHDFMLEVTESAAMTDVAPALENLARLRMRGFGLSIDDYGTGYSSMQQLTRVAFTELKIDQSFVRGAALNPALRIVVESSIEMARRLRVTSVAEGVETQQDWDTLKQLGCDTCQGYLIARPMALGAFHDFCARHGTRRG